MRLWSASDENMYVVCTYKLSVRLNTTKKIDGARKLAKLALDIPSIIVVGEALAWLQFQPEQYFLAKFQQIERAIKARGRMLGNIGRD